MSERVKVARQSTLRVTDSSATHAFSRVEIFPTWWEDEIVIEVWKDGADGDGGLVTDPPMPIEWTVGADGGLDVAAGASTAPVLLRAMVPSYFDLDVSLLSGDVVVHDKVEGTRTQTLETGGAGSIRVHKLRGPGVRIRSGTVGGVRVGSAVEGRLTIDAGAGGLRGKLLMGPTARIKTSGSVDIAAMYCADARVQAGVPAPGVPAPDAAEEASVVGRGASGSACDLVLGTVQGRCDLSAPRGRIEAGSVTGALRADAGGSGGVRAHYDVLSGENILRATGSGGVDVSVAAPVTANLRLSASEQVRVDCPEGSLRKESSGEPRAPREGTGDALRGRLVLLDDGSGSASRAGPASGSGKISHAGRAKAATEAAEAASDSGATLEARASCGGVSLRVLSWVQMMQEKIGLSR